MVDVGKGNTVAAEQNLLYVPQERLIDLRPFALGQVNNLFCDPHRIVTRKQS